MKNEKNSDVVMRAANLERHSLPATLDRPPGKDKLGTAAQVIHLGIREGERFFLYFSIFALFSALLFFFFNTRTEITEQDKI